MKFKVSAFVPFASYTRSEHGRHSQLKIVQNKLLELFSVPDIHTFHFYISDVWKYAN